MKLESSIKENIVFTVPSEKLESFFEYLLHKEYTGIIAFVVDGKEINFVYYPESYPNCRPS